MPENGKPIVTILYPEQHEQAAVSLGRAFINDPAFKAIPPDITASSSDGDLCITQEPKNRSA